MIYLSDSNGSIPGALALKGPAKRVKKAPTKKRKAP